MRLGDLVRGRPRSQAAALCRCRPGLRWGVGTHAASPAQTAPGEGLITGCARRSGRELYLYGELEVEPLARGVRAVAKHKAVSMLSVEAERRQIHAQGSGVILVTTVIFLRDLLEAD